MQALFRPDEDACGSLRSRDANFKLVNDIVEALTRAPDAPAGSVINVGGGHRVTLLEALDVLADVAGRAPLLRMKGPEPGDARDTWADLSRAHEYLGYAPRVGLRDGLAVEWDWIREQET